MALEFRWQKHLLQQTEYKGVTLYIERLLFLNSNFYIKTEQLFFSFLKDILQSVTSSQIQYQMTLNG